MMFDIKIEVWGWKWVQIQGYIVDISNDKNNAIQKYTKGFLFLFSSGKIMIFWGKKKSQIGHI